MKINPTKVALYASIIALFLPVFYISMDFTVNYLAKARVSDPIILILALVVDILTTWHSVEIESKENKS